MFPISHLLKIPAACACVLHITYPYGLRKWLDRVLNKGLLFFSYWAVVLILNIPKPYNFAGPAECNKKSPSCSDHHVQNPKDQREQRAACSHGNVRDPQRPRRTMTSAFLGNAKEKCMSA